MQSTSETDDFAELKIEVLKKMRILVSHCGDPNLIKYKDNDRILLNLSLRGGWGIDLWEDIHIENMMTIKLVSEGNKKIGSLVSQDYTKKYFDQYIRYAEESGCETCILKNLYGMFILYVFNSDIPIDHIHELDNETMAWYNIGYYYGYNDNEKYELIETDI